MSAVRKLASQSRSAEVTAEVIEVTPKMAKEWLATHENIRPLSEKRVESLAEDMEKGRWKVTHQGICFDEDGKLIDGQHRLHAVVKANVPVRMLVCHSRGVTIHDALDRGTPRRLATLTGRKTREISAVGVLRFFEAGEVNRPGGPDDAIFQELLNTGTNGPDCREPRTLLSPASPYSFRGFSFHVGPLHYVVIRYKH
jgi:hypothetical protein